MATRFYLPSSDKSSSLVVAPSGSWGITTGYRRSRMVTTREGSSFASWSSSETSAGNIDVCVAQFLSAPLKAQTITGTVKGILRALESLDDSDFCAQMIIRVVDAIGTTFRGTLLAFDTSGLASEFDALTLTNRKFPLAWTSPGAALGSVDAIDFDRLVIEVGFRSYNATGDSRTGTLEVGDLSAIDLAEDETSTDQFSPWIEFSQDLVFMDDQSSTRGLSSESATAAGLESTTSYVSYGTTQAEGTSSESHGSYDSWSLDGRLNDRPDEQMPPVVGGAPPVVTHYMKRSWRLESSAYVTWETTDPIDPYPGGGTLDPPLGTILYQWTT